MSEPGLGVMIKALGGNEASVKAFRSSQKKIISAIEFAENDSILRLVFADGYELRLEDQGQSCCETRYMRTDDTLADFFGAELLDIELRDAPNVEDIDDHEVQFLVIKTSKGQFVMSNHNEHNGYYGGFWIEATLIEPNIASSHPALPGANGAA